MLYEIEKTVQDTRELLAENVEWHKRYQGYADKLIANLDYLKSVRGSFNQWKPLMVYINYSNASRANTVSLQLRYRGQSVADLIYRQGKDVLLDTGRFNATNKRDFACDIRLDRVEWKGLEAREFRAHFKSNPIRNENSPRANEEHRVESMLLTEFSKRASQYKALCRIQPVKIANIRFPMPTPISASNHKLVKYSGQHGGGIDLLARIGTGGRATYLCIMELKDENTRAEPPIDALKQAVAYTTFIRELLRSECGSSWWRLFGFNGDIPKKLKLFATCVMPTNDNDDKSFEDKEIYIDDDVIKLEYVYYIEDNNEIKNIDTSLYIHKK